MQTGRRSAHDDVQQVPGTCGCGLVGGQAISRQPGSRRQRLLLHAYPFASMGTMLWRQCVDCTAAQHGPPHAVPPTTLLDPPPSPPFVFLPNPKQVVELSQQNTTLEEEALALEQKLGDAEQSVVGLELKVMQLEKQVNSGNTEMSAALEKAQVRR